MRKKIIGVLGDLVVNQMGWWRAQFLAFIPRPSTHERLDAIACPA